MCDYYIIKLEQTKEKRKLFGKWHIIETIDQIVLRRKKETTLYFIAIFYLHSIKFMV